MSQRGKYKRVKQPVEDRFFSKVEEVESGCWEWQAGGNGVGYGVFHPTREKKVLSHRWCYEHIIGKIPEGLYLDHLCRNRGCCNPEHLEPVTHRENILRGKNPPADNKVKTHCINGHEFNKENTYVWQGERTCRSCANSRQKRYRVKKKEAKLEAEKTNVIRA